MNLKFFKQFSSALIAAAVVAALFMPGYSKLQKLKNRNTDLSTKNRQLAIENKLLKTELDRFEKDKLYQEKILREKMGVVRKDEVPVKIINEQLAD